MKNLGVLLLGGLIIFINSLFEKPKEEVKELSIDESVYREIEYLESSQEYLYSTVKSDQELINYQLDTIKQYIEKRK